MRMIAFTGNHTKEARLIAMEDDYESNSGYESPTKKRKVTPQVQYIAFEPLPFTGFEKPTEILLDEPNQGRLYLSNATIASEEALKTFSELGITHIISLADPVKETGRELALHDYNIEDDFEFNKEKFKTSASTIDRLLREKYTVLIHCREGMSRSVSNIVYFLVKYRNHSLSQALRLLNSSGVSAEKIGLHFRIYLDNMAWNKMEIEGRRPRSPPRSPRRNSSAPLTWFVPDNGSTTRNGLETVNL